jgi:pimeloyl-ACP methyl ester carboxylesterase
MTTEKISFTGGESVQLAGVLHLPVSSTAVAAIFAHGFCSNMTRERYVMLSDALAEKGIAALRFDFAGSGESEEREITISGQVADLKAAVAYLQKRGYRSIGVVGESLGGITALEAYSDAVKALVLWAPVTKARWTAEMSGIQKESLNRRGYYINHKDGKDFKIPKRYVEERLGVNRARTLGEFRIPVFIIHGTEDEVIPVEDSREAIALLPQGSRLEEIQGGDHHVSAIHSELVIRKTVDWLVSHLQKQSI